MNFSEAEKNLGYTFKDKNLLRRALTLASADGVNNNQRLEFFGDAILEFLVSERIYDESKSEGLLTERRKSIVSDRALKPVSLKLGLDKFLIRSEYDKTNKKAIPSAYEAVVAAIYLDGGLDAAKDFINRTLDFKVGYERNFKGELQEYMQGRGGDCPKYFRRDVGTPQSPEFIAEVEVNGKKFSGKAGNIKVAEQLAAAEALKYLHGNKD